MLFACSVSFALRCVLLVGWFELSVVCYGLYVRWQFGVICFCCCSLLAFVGFLLSIVVLRLLVVGCCLLLCVVRCVLFVVCCVLCVVVCSCVSLCVVVCCCVLHVVC